MTIVSRPVPRAAIFHSVVLECANEHEHGPANISAAMAGGWVLLTVVFASQLRWAGYAPWPTALWLEAIY